MFQYLIFAVIIIILISLTYWIFIHNGDQARRKLSAILLRKSGGVDGPQARAALNELAEIRNPTPRDHFRRAGIYHYNILQGDLQHDHRAAIGHAIRGYTTAIIGMRNYGRNDRGHINRDRADENDDFMLQHINNFHNDLLQIDINDDILADIILDFDTVIAANAPAVHQDIIQGRRKRARDKAATRAEAINNYFDDAIAYTNDAQNVHDSKVNGDLNYTLRRLKSAARPPPVAKCFDEAREYIKNEYSADPANAEKSVNALRTLDRMAEGNKISIFDETEDNIFAYVWDRCNHGDNHNNAALMREAIVTALADCMENGTQVCINGRCGRILGSLVLLDYDKSVGSAMTFEAYKNQIFQETKTIIGDEIDRAKASDNEDIRAAAEAYDNAANTASVGSEQFKQAIKGRIDENLGKYAGKFTDIELANIREECYVYATL